MDIRLRNDPYVRMCVHMPRALVGRWENGQEVGQGLPPYAPIQAHPVDDFPELPDDWERSTEDTATYVVGLAEGNGMWFDFTQLPKHPTHDVAVRMSVQGVCALTGMELTSGQMPLHQYRHRCPVHGVAFMGNLFCPQCDHEWLPQNYLASTAPVRMWIDGFWASTGKNRQFLITAEEGRGVAAQLIGGRRTFDLTFAFFKSKEQKVGDDSDDIGSSSQPDYEVFRGGRGVLRRVTRDLEIGAGALINQCIGTDPKEIEHWNGQRIGTVKIYYMPADQLAQILAARAQRAERQGGFLGGNGLKVGNDGGNKKF
ncbi:hypothetical protein A2348_01935 [Candidatus Uhrbacteria bacterium RIFOXYB12_FULL_58_10]|nr:MAG: hypothetical protein A2348_01935 [Candidatus Uhrbacteria bacterium RIFOXYB12_FULL_58_10]